MENVEAKRLRLDDSLMRNARIENEKLQLKIYQNHLRAQCIEDNYINKLLDSTRNLIKNSEELFVESRAIATAINTFGLRKTPSMLDMLGGGGPSDELQHEESSPSSSSLPSTSYSKSSTSTSSTSSSTSTSVSPNLPTFESSAIDHAIDSIGLHNRDFNI